MFVNPQFGNRHNNRSLSVNRAKHFVRGAMALSLGLGVAGIAVASSSSHASGPAAPAFELATIADTAYAIPTNALFVATNGSDTNAGSQTAPFATVTRAVRAATGGQTIVLRGGTYREAVGSVTRSITIQAYPHEQVWLKGSILVNGFAPSGGQWVRNGWSTSNCETCYPTTALDPNYPAAGLTDQVFIDGVPLLQVVARSQVVPGTFYVDTSNAQLVLGADPGSSVVEATVFDKAMQFNTNGASGSIVRGIGVAHYASHFNMDVPSMIVANAPNITLDHDTFAWSASRGLSVFAPGAVVTDNTFLYNGINGFHGNTADGLRFQRNRIAYSNQEHFDTSPNPAAQLAGAKVTWSSNVVMTDNVVENNNSNGLWFDLSAYNSTVANNIVHDNAGHGIEYEVSGKGVIVGNVLANNGRDGIKISGSTDVDIWNNTSVNNAAAQLGVYDDPRSNTNAAQIALGMTWDTANVSVVNNVFVGNASTTPLVQSFDATSPRHTTTLSMLARDDNNLWVRPNPASPNSVAYWQPAISGSKSYSNLAALQSATGRESVSVAADGTPIANLFADPTSNDYHALAGSPVAQAGASLPSNVVAAMGTQVHPYLGALTVGVAGGGNGGGGTTTTVPAATTTIPAPTTTIPVPTTTIPVPTTTIPVPTTTIPVPTTTTVSGQTGGVTVRELVNKRNGDHIYTVSATESSQLVAGGYTLTTVQFKASTSGGTGLMPVYRLLGQSTNHVFTALASERDSAIRHGWKLEGVGFYVPSGRGSGTVPVYRYYDTVTNDHLMNLSATAPKNARRDGLVFYAAP